MSVSINGTNGLVFNDGSAQNTSPFTGGFGFRNRIINGAMVIDQRNNGSSITPASGAFVYNVDRWGTYQTQASKITVQQNAGSVTPPAGFSNYVGITSSSAYSVISSDQFLLEQAIEANNVSDFNYGTANAVTVTLSFLVYSSLTGTFAGCLRNYAGTRSYPFTYTISAANTWEQKSITIPGDTSGTWVTSGTGGSMYVIFNLGSGSTYLGTANAWASANYTSVSGSVNVVGTNGATFYVTGVDLQKGNTATSFDYRPYGTELALCQRYFQKSWPIETAVGTATSSGVVIAGGSNVGATTGLISGGSINFKVNLRGTPTIVIYDTAGNAGKTQRWQLGVSNVNNSNVTVESISSTSCLVYSDSGSSGSGLQSHYTASAEL
jgi:hypothetical protein